MVDLYEKHGKEFEGKYWLGLDCSTQSLKVCVVTIRENSVVPLENTYTINYDSDLPQFKTVGGCHRSEKDGRRVTTPVLVWVAALDLVLDRMKNDGFDFNKVVAISGAGQQHGSVYWKTGALALLHKLSPESSLTSQLSEAFSIKDSPIWMDSSTQNECTRFEKLLHERLGNTKSSANEGDLSANQSLLTARLTGSKAHKRFTGHQIRKIKKEYKEEYKVTERIGLVSSFVASLFIQSYSPIDASDGSGMNILDIRHKEWLEDALQICVGRASSNGLREKLGSSVVDSYKVVGKIGNFFVSRYGFNSSASVIAFSGDNPCSLAGLTPLTAGVEGESLAISLGTSDTLFGIVSSPSAMAEGHLFFNCIDPKNYMLMLCYSNGSLTRQFIRDLFSGGDWNKFDQALKSTPPGNNGKIGFFYHVPEIVPDAKAAIYLLDKDDKLQTFPADFERNEALSFSNDEVVRAVVEGHFLAMMAHTESIGLNLAAIKHIVATGGASSNQHMLHVISDIWGVPVLTSTISSSAALGSAYRALHGHVCEEKKEFVSFGQVAKRATEPEFRVAAKPKEEVHKQVYIPMLQRYKKLETIVRGCSH